MRDAESGSGRKPKAKIRKKQPQASSPFGAVKQATKPAPAAKPKTPTKPAPAKAPVSDVRSSGPNYDRRKVQRAENQQARERDADRGKHQDRLTDEDRRKLATAAAIGPLGKGATGQADVKKPNGGGGLATIAALGSAVGPIAATADALKGGKALKGVLKLGKNAATDAAELAVTTPSSLYKLADTAVHDPGKVPGMLAEPYKELAKDPVKFATERPVSTALMLDPVLRVPGKAAGKVLRATGKQTLKREPATLPGTAIKVTRTKSKDALINRAQTKADAKKPAPTISAEAGREVKVRGKEKTVVRTELQRRVDEHFDTARKHEQRLRDSAAQRAKQAGLTGDEARAHIDAEMGGAKKYLARRFGEEFGSTWVIDKKTGAIIKHKTGDKGVRYKTRAEADRIAEKLPFDAKVHQAGTGFYVVPEVAAKRLARHKTVGTSPSVGAAVLRTSGKAFRSAVLPVSAKWLTGQVTEAGLRSAVAGAGPLSFVRAGKVVKAMERNVPGSGKELLARTMGGHFDLTGTAREFATGGRTLADEFSSTSLARHAQKVTDAAAKPGIRHVREGWRKYSDFVFDTVNGKIEHTAQKAMLGKALKESPLMERSLIGLSDKAIQEAAAGLKGTETQIHLAREIDRMYGQYQKFGPDKREALLHWTPFYPWFKNMATFLTKVLPVDHPLYAASLASLDAATEDWRKANGLSLRGPHRSPFLLGSAPQGEQVIRIGRYMPFMPADPLGDTAGLVLPQAEAIEQLKSGVDFKGAKIRKRQLQNALATAAESFIPGVGPANQITGLTDKYVRGDDKETVLDGKDLRKAIEDYLNPAAKTKSKPKKLRRKSTGGGFGGLGSGGGSGFGGLG